VRRLVNPGICRDGTNPRAAHRVRSMARSDVAERCLGHMRGMKQTVIVTKSKRPTIAWFGLWLSLVVLIYIIFLFGR
jgi:hypothetical protein